MNPLVFNSHHLNEMQKGLEKDSKKIKERETLKSQIGERSTLNRASFRQKSILDSHASFLAPLIKEAENTKIDLTRVLALINLGYAASKTGYEGGDTLEIARLFELIFEIIQQGKGVFSKDLPADLLESVKHIQQLKPLSSIKEKSGHVMRQIQALEPGKSYTMEGGWVGVPSGHAMIYRFERAAGDKFNIYIYNASNGTEEINGGLTNLYQKKSQPCFCFQGVTWEELFFAKPERPGNPTIFFHLLTLLDPKTMPTNCSIKVILGYFGHLAHRQVPSSRLSSVFISMQRSGNCPVKSMNCLILDLMNKHSGDVGAIRRYKQLSLDLRLFSLMACWHALKKKEPSKVEDAHLFLFKEAAANFLRMLQVNYGRNNSMRFENYTAAAATVEHLLQEIDAMEKERSAKVAHAQPLSPSYVSSREADKAQARQEFIQVLPSLFRPPKATVEERSIFLSSRLGANASWQSLNDVLSTLKSSADLLIKQGKTQELAFQIEATLRNLSPLKNQNAQLSPEEAKKLQQTLLAIQRQYNEAIFKIDQIGSPAAANTAMEFLALSYSLALQIDTNYQVLNRYGIYAEHFLNLAKKDRLFALQDNELLAQRQDLERFFKAHKTKGCLFNFETQKFNEEEFLKGSIPEGDLFKNYGTNQNIEKEFASLLLKGGKKYTHGSVVPFLSLEEIDFPSQLKHICTLKLAAFSAFETCGIGQSGDKAGSTNMFNLGGNLYFFSKSGSWSIEGKKNPHFYNRSRLQFSSNASIDAYIKHPQSSHELDQILPENALLANQSTDQSDENLPFYLALAEPTLQTSLLLKEVHNSIDRLKQTSFRQLLSCLFFKTIESPQGTVSPFRTFLEDRSNLARIEHLVRRGKKEFVDLSAEEKPSLDEMLFLIRFYAQSLQMACSLHPTQRIWNQTLVDELHTFLAKAIQLPHLSEELKKEVRLAKVGLLLAIPLEQLSRDRQVDLFLSFMSLKNELPPKSACADPIFLDLCKKRFFELDGKWQSLFGNEAVCQEFGNQLLARALNANTASLKWTLRQRQLNGSDQSESWTIDFSEPCIKNARGPLIESHQPLESTPSFKRLFQDRRYNLKVFGDETRFEDPIWGSIRIVGKGSKAIIQRLVDHKWYTYVPVEHTSRTELKLNKALIYDHALWFDTQHPQNVQICDLKTGKPLYSLKDGTIEDLASKEIVHTINYPKDSIYRYEAIERFEDLEYVNGKISSHKLSQANDKLEFSRFCSAEGNPLSFIWDAAQGWIYSENALYSIDQEALLPSTFKVDHYLLLKDEKSAKRKLLIPVGKMASKGFSPVAEIKMQDPDQDGQKEALTFFEYDLEGTQVIPQSLDAKIYLIHLYLAQKNYRQAFEWLKTISMSENPSEKAVQLILSLLNSAGSLQDLSPNACAIRLLAYLVFKRLRPLAFFSDDGSASKEMDCIKNNYQIYLQGQNNLEQPLIIPQESELEIIHFCQRAMAQMTNCPKEMMDLITEREVYFKSQTIISKSTIIEAANVKNALISPPVKHIFFYITSQEESKKRCEEANDLFKNETTGKFLDQFVDFADLYEKIRQNQDPEVIQGIFYNLLRTSSINAKRQEILFLIAQAPEAAPKLPATNASNEEKFIWYKALKDLYEKHKSKPTKSCDFAIQSKRDKRQENCPLTPIVPSSPVTMQNSTHEQAIATARRSQDSQFYQWQEEFLELRGEISVPPTLGATHAKGVVLKDAELDYAQTVDKHIKHYHTDCQVAHESEKSKRVFKKNANLDALLHAMQHDHQEAADNEKTLEAFIYELAQRRPSAFVEYVKNQVVSIGQAHAKPPLEAILRAAVQKDAQKSLKKLNPDLSDAEVQALQSACIELMIETTHRRQLDRVIKPLARWIKEGKINSTDLEMAEEAMREARSYNPHKQLFPLLFEFLSGLRVRPKQAIIIDSVLSDLLAKEDGKLKGKVFQLIMAGGKTSVILSMLIEIASQEGLLSCVMCHHSQLTSTKGNLAAFQSKRFAKDVYILDCSMQELADLKMLDVILKNLQDAGRRGCALIMRTSFPQILELKFILESKKLFNIRNAEEKQKQYELINKLRNINQIFRDKGASFYDEGDINLSILTDVHIPLGEQKNILPERANLVKEIFSTLISPELKDIVKLDKNQQADLSYQEFENQILKTIAEKLFLYPPFYLNKHLHLKGAFIRYVCGKIKFEEQRLADQPQAHLSSLSQEQQENIQFLRLLGKLSQSEDRYDREAAHLMAVARRVMTKVLKTSLSHSYNRRYGRDASAANGRVIPFLAVGTPATTRFGNMYLALAYQFQAALNEGIGQGQVAFLAEKMSDAANYYAKKDRVPFLETVEAKQFQSLTGISLDQASNPKKLEEALAYINDPAHLERRLDVEAEVTPFHVRYNTQRVSSNSINNVSQFKRPVTCSATIWNHPTYHRCFGDPMIDKGTEGTILNLLATRAENNPHAIHEIASLKLEDLFALIRRHPNKGRIRAIADAGGFLRDYTNAQVAPQLLQFLSDEEQNSGPQVKAIVYLHQFSAQEIQEGSPKESYVLLKKGDPKPRLLKNTATEEIERHGIGINEIFVLFDELRCTGTDIELDDKAVFLTTVDHRMPMRTALQSALRARKIFKDQRVEFVVSTKGRTEMVNQGKTFADLQKTWEKNEAIMLKEQTDRARMGQLEDVIRSAIIQELLMENRLDRFERLMSQYEKFLVFNFEDNPYNQAGRILEKGPALTVLRAYASNIIGVFEATRSPSLSKIKEEMAALLSRLEKEIPVDETMEFPVDRDLDATLEIVEEDEVNLQLEDEQTLELNQQLQTELQSYCYSPSSGPYVEVPFAQILKQGQSTWHQIKSRLFPMKQVLEQNYKGGASTSAYVPCFSERLWMTDNFRYTVREQLPVFHPLSKDPKYVLMVKNEFHQYEFVLLSEKDAAFFKQWLRDTKCQDAFLVDLEGYPEGNKESFEAHAKSFGNALEEGLWYANLFSGNIDFLESHSDLSKKLLVSRKDLAAKYIQLRTAKKTDQLRKLSTSSLFDFRSGFSAQHEGVLFSARRAYIERKYKTVTQLGFSEVATLAPEDVEHVASHQVPWLKTPQQLEYLPNGMLDHLLLTQLSLLQPARVVHLTQKHLIQALKGDHVKALSTAQYSSLLPSQVQWIEDRYLGDIPKEVVHLITDVEQINRFKGRFVKRLSEGQINGIRGEDVEHLDDNQFAWLTQKELIQHVPFNKLALIKNDCRAHLEKMEAILALPNEEGLTQKQKQFIQQHFAAGFNESDLQGWHVRFIPEEKLSSLTLEHLIWQIPSHMASKITRNQARHLREEDKGLIAQLEYPAFTGIKRELYHLFNEKQLKRLDTKQAIDRIILGSLTAKQASYLDDRQLEYISIDTMNELDLKDLQRLKMPHLLKLNETNLARISEDQIQQIRTSFESIQTTEQLKDIADNLLRFLPDSKVELVDSSRVSALQARQWSHLSKSQVQAINWDDRASFLKALVQALSANALEALPAKYHTFLEDRQWALLNDKHLGLIQSIRSAALFSKLSDSALQFIETSQIAFLQQEDFKRLINPKLLLAAPQHPCFAWLEPRQKEILAKAIETIDLTRIAPHYLEFVTRQRIEGFKVKEAILALPLNQVAFLSKAQVELIPPAELKVDFIRHLGPQGIEALNQERYAMCGNYLSQAQLNALSPAHDQIIKHLSGDNLSHVKDDVLQEITKAQVGTLSVENLNRLTKPELLLSILDEYYSLLSETAKARLRDAVNQLTDISLLQFSHLPLLTKDAALLGKIDAPWMLSQLNPSLFAHLSQKQLELLEDQKLSMEQLQAIPAARLKYLTNPHHIALISEKQIGEMGDAHQFQIKLLTENQISQIQKFPKDLISILPKEKLKFLNPNAVNLENVPENLRKYLSDKQLEALYNRSDARPKQVLQGLVLSLIILPRIVLQFAFNLAILLGTVFLSIWMRSQRSRVEKRARETFVNAPVRALGSCFMMFNYAKYQRLYFEYGGE